MLRGHGDSGIAFGGNTDQSSTSRGGSRPGGRVRESSVPLDVKCIRNKLLSRPVRWKTIAADIIAANKEIKLSNEDMATLTSSHPGTGQQTLTQAGVTIPAALNHV